MVELACSRCKAAVLPTGVCSACGHNAHIDLEIAAFMAPHINRARIMLVAIGVLYLMLGYLAYSDLAAVRESLGDALTGTPMYDELREAITIAYVIVGFVAVSGAANIVLAAVAGTKTMLAFNLAVGIFVLHTCLQAYASGGTFVTSLLWWITAIILGLGYQAARKAERLRDGPL